MYGALVDDIIAEREVRQLMVLHGDSVFVCTVSNASRSAVLKASEWLNNQLSSVAKCNLNPMRFSAWNTVYVLVLVTDPNIVFCSRGGLLDTRTHHLLLMEVVSLFALVEQEVDTVLLE